MDHPIPAHREDLPRPKVDFITKDKDLSPFILWRMEDLTHLMAGQMVIKHGICRCLFGMVMELVDLSIKLVADDWTYQIQGNPVS